MVDKELFKLIGGNKKYIFIAVLLQASGWLQTLRLPEAFATPCIC